MAQISPDELGFATRSDLDVLGTNIELYTAGSGDPVLFLHGIDGVEGAAPLIRAMARTHTVYAPVHPGFGDSARPGNLNRVDDLGYFYLDMLAALGLDRPLIVGSSFGAWVAAETLTKDPERASALVMISALGLPTANRREQYVADIFMMSRQQLNDSLGRQEAPLAEASEYRLRREMRGDEALSLYGWSPYMSNPKLPGRMHRIQCPALLVWGEQDAIVSATYRRAFSDAMPAAEVRHIKESGHRVHADQPGELAGIIEEFTTLSLSRGDVS